MKAASLKELCFRCGCYIPQSWAACPACGAEKGAPSTARQGRLPCQCSAGLRTEKDDYTGEPYLVKSCIGGVGRMKLTIRDLSKNCTEVELIEKMCLGCYRLKGIN